MSASLDLSFHIGETWRIAFTACDENGVPIDIGGGTVRFRLSNSGVPVLTVSTDDAVSIGDGLGEAKIEITPAIQTLANIDESVTYRYELQIETAAFGTSTQATGKLAVLPSLFTEAEPS
jgi:hypothetical protein